MESEVVGGISKGNVVHGDLGILGIKFSLVTSQPALKNT